MSAQVRRLKIVVILTVILSLAIVILVPSSSVVGITLRVGPEGLPLPQGDFSAVPPSVVEDATRLATELYGDYQEEGNDFVNQLLALYLEAKDKDFVMFFNSGGWGWSLLDASPGWHSIFIGIESELSSSGYTSLLLNHLRTVETLHGYLDEAVEMITGYSSKAKDLASRVDFLTTNIPELKVIITGESNGTIISDKVMKILEGNPQVYSIQTGPPFWYKNIMLDRTLVMTSNGIIPDSFSRGDFLTMISASLKDLFGLPRVEADYGRILLFARAPGHDYRWHYPSVYYQITNFLQQNFGLK